MWRRRHGAQRADNGSTLGVLLGCGFPPGTRGDVFRQAFDQVIAPVIERFDPTWLIISAGFDGHRNDPLAGLHWTTEDFGWITDRICDLAADCCGGRLVSTLEGGYDLEALAESVGLHVEVLMERGA